MANVLSNTMNSIKILALRPLETPIQIPEEISNGVLGVKMHRILKTGHLYKFHSQIDIDMPTITLKMDAPAELYNINQGDQASSITVNISAIVGENGSGKSTIIDYIIRIINNLSAVLWGEYYYNSSSEHLHYIQDVYAELFVLIDECVYCIVNRGEELCIEKYVIDKKISTKECAVFRKNDREKEIFNAKHNKPCERSIKCFDLLSKLFYTIIVNYSLYSFDTNTYLEELTTDKKEQIVYDHGIKQNLTTKAFKSIKEFSEQNDRKEYLDAKSWLSGVLRKYDDYQIPLLITPSRQNGQVDKRKEYVNGKERILSLTILQDKNGKRVFTKINNNEIIDRITLKLDSTFARQTYYSVFENSFPKLSRVVRLSLFHLVRNTLIEKFQIEKTDGQIENTVWCFIVFKVFDLVLTYPEYKEYRNAFQRITNRLDTQIIATVKEVIERICDNHSHATRLFMRCIFFLKYNLLNNIATNVKPGEFLREYELSIDVLSQESYTLLNNNKNIIHYVDELLPPPIFNVDFKLYRDNKEDVITFETLSSGEKQITLSLSTIYYYLTHLDSKIDNNYTEANGNAERKGVGNNNIRYRHVCVIFDEIELYFHPEMQRTFIERLLYGLKQLSFRSIKSIQFIIVTHSPFVLSDVPRSNVLFLDKNGESRSIERMHTFGANIHTMLEHSFFLENGTIGAFAKKIIGEIEACLNIYKNKKDFEMYKDEFDFLEEFFHDDHDKNGFNLEEFRESYPKERIKATIELFDEPIIKKVLLNDYYETFPEDKKSKKEEEIKKLEEQLDSLKKAAQKVLNDKVIEDLISELENRKKDLENEK